MGNLLAAAVHAANLHDTMSGIIPLTAARWTIRRYRNPQGSKVFILAAGVENRATAGGQFKATMSL